MKKHHNKTLRFNPNIDKAYRLLFGTEPAGCTICGEDNPDLLGIHPHDYHEKEWRTLCEKCYFNFDNKLQKQIGGSYV